MMRGLYLGQKPKGTTCLEKAGEETKKLKKIKKDKNPMINLFPEFIIFGSLFLSRDPLPYLRSNP
jgi:hypothetical protein